MLSDNEGKTNATVIIVVLVIALLVVFFLWQRDQESQDLEIDIGREGAAVPALVAPGPRLA